MIRIFAFSCYSFSSYVIPTARHWGNFTRVKCSSSFFAFACGDADHVDVNDDGSDHDDDVDTNDDDDWFIGSRSKVA